MRLDGARAEPEAFGDVARRETGRDEPENLALPRGQGGELLLRLGAGSSGERGAQPVAVQDEPELAAELLDEGQIRGSVAAAALGPGDGESAEHDPSRVGSGTTTREWMPSWATTRDRPHASGSAWRTTRGMSATRSTARERIATTGPKRASGSSGKQSRWRAPGRHARRSRAPRRGG